MRSTNHQERELLLSRIIAACAQVRSPTTPLLLKQPSRLHRMLAQEVYAESLRDAEIEGLYTEDELLAKMRSEALWDADDQIALDDMVKNLDELKVQLFELAFKSNERQLVRKMLAVTRAEHERLINLRHAYDHLSCQGAAAIARSRYLVGASLFYADGRAVFDMEGFWRSQNNLIDRALEHIQANAVSETHYRELARNDPWRSLWACRKSEASVFGVPAVDLTNDQKALIVWSVNYDAIHEHPECPSSVVVEDDDMLDGWMIVQRRKRESDLEKNKLESLISNERIRNSEEVFIPVDTREDAKKIAELNPLGARKIKRQRELTIQKFGTVEEANMPDSKLKIQRAVTEGFKQHVKG